MEPELWILALFMGALVFIAIPLLLWYGHKQGKKLTEQHQRDTEKLDGQLQRGDIPPEVYERLIIQLGEQFRKKAM